MKTISIPINEGTPMKAIVDSLLREMVKAGVGTHAHLEKELYWALTEMREQRMITKAQRRQADKFYGPIQTGS